MKRKVTSIPSDINPNFLNDKKKLKKLFKMNRVEMPSFFEQLSNKLKSKRERKSVFKYVEDYLKGNTITKIRRDMSTAKWIKKKPRVSTSVRTVAKR
jgi:hypothetical protein